VLGEVPVAFVSLRPEATASAESLASHVRGILSAFKCPTRITILDELPKNPVGKIDKPTLRRGLQVAS
jgi:long-chain acyl-CoA synthetase